MELQNKTVIVTGAAVALAWHWQLSSLHTAPTWCAADGANRRSMKPHPTSHSAAAQRWPFPPTSPITSSPQVGRCDPEAVRSNPRVVQQCRQFPIDCGVHEVDPKVWWQDVTINLLGSLLTIREVLPTCFSVTRESSSI